MINTIRNFIGFGIAPPQSIDKKRIQSTIAPIQLQRIKQDTQSWREAISEAERAYFPFRVQQQTLYIDTVLNGHVSACIDRRKDLTTLREWHITNKSGAVDEVSTNLLKEKWFSDFIGLALDSLFYGYSLISLGDCVDGKFKDIETVKRWNVSPDRLIVSNTTYDATGTSFLDPPYKDWHIYVKTLNDSGVSKCGYGLLYNVGIYEIFLRNILGYNGDYVELFGTPMRIIKSNKVTEDERNELALAAQEMGSTGFIILDMLDEITLLERKDSGSGYMSYDNLEARIESKISKIILGHADAMDSVPGKLGAGAGIENPVNDAKRDKQSKDGLFIKDIINTELIPKLRKIGFAFPNDIIFEFKNDSEINENNAKLTSLAVDIKKAGLQMDKDYFEKQTGIKLMDAPIAPAPAFTPSIKNKLENLYK